MTEGQVNRHPKQMNQVSLMSLSGTSLFWAPSDKSKCPDSRVPSFHGVKFINVNSVHKLLFNLVLLIQGVGMEWCHFPHMSENENLNDVLCLMSFMRALNRRSNGCRSPSFIIHRPNNRKYHIKHRPSFF